ncbi:MAG: class I SAM-dependent methyltransferase [Roseinatronobacter sp.]
MRYTVYFDAALGYGQVWPRPSADEIARAYDVEEYYTHHLAKGTTQARVPVMDRILNRLAWSRDHGVDADRDWWIRVLGSEPLRILEIGCGNGANLALLQSLGHNVTGIEPDPAARRLALGRGLTILEGHAETLPDAVLAQTFDLIMFMHVLEHCILPTRALEQARNLLSPGGRMVIEVPNSDCLGHAHFGALWFWLDVPRHLNFFTPRALERMLADIGMTRDSLEFTGYVRGFQPGWRRMQDQIAASFGLSAIPATRYWSYLARTAFAQPAQRYDTFRIVARVA